MSESICLSKVGKQLRQELRSIIGDDSLCNSMSCKYIIELVYNCLTCESVYFFQIRRIKSNNVLQSSIVHYST